MANSENNKHARLKINKLGLGLMHNRSNDAAQLDLVRHRSKSSTCISDTMMVINVGSVNFKIFNKCRAYLSNRNSSWVKNGWLRLAK